MFGFNENKPAVAYCHGTAEPHGEKTDNRSVADAFFQVNSPNIGMHSECHG